MKNILIVDDSFFMRNMIKKIVQDIDNSWTILEAENGEKALNKIQQNNFDLIISDLNMPYLSGFSLLEKLHNKRNFSMKILIVSSETDEKIIEKVKKLGAADYIIKPFESKILKTKINTIFE